MNITHEEVNKISIRKRKTIDADLAEQLESLQRAFAQERGESHRFREEIRALLRHGP